MQCRIVVDKSDLVKCIKLGRHHYNEVEKEFTGLPYKPKLSMFITLFEQGYIQCVALYDGDKVEGYVMVSISPNLLSDCDTAQEIGLYLSPKNRGVGWFTKMLEMTEVSLAQRNVHSLLLAFKAGTTYSIPKGYREDESLYIKRLEK